eukprot:scaffold547_cov384-Prasinococcus_capsulatus_cf.AAC.48
MKRPAWAPPSGPRAPAGTVLRPVATRRTDRRLRTVPQPSINHCKERYPQRAGEAGLSGSRARSPPGKAIPGERSYASLSESL